jgi:hypothetical protein
VTASTIPNVLEEPLRSGRLPNTVANREDYELLRRVIDEREREIRSNQIERYVLIARCIGSLLIAAVAVYVLPGIESQSFSQFLILTCASIFPIHGAVCVYRFAKIATQLRIDRLVQSHLLAFARELGPFLADSGDISRIQTEFMKLDLSRYGI